MTLTEEQVARLRFLEDHAGRLTPGGVLADARDVASPLHPLIDWDPTKAAEAHWLECAREIIRTVKVVVTTETTTVRAPYYVRDPDAEGQGYRSVVTLRVGPEAAREALRGELTRAAGQMTRARHLAIVLELADEFDAMIATIAGLQVRLEDEQPPPQPSVS